MQETQDKEKTVAESGKEKVIKNEKKQKTAEVKQEKVKPNPLEAKVAELQKANEKLLNDYAKAYADTENTRKRLNQEAETNRKYCIQDFARTVLPVLDNLERALKIEVKSEEALNYRQGMEMIYKQLRTALFNEGVQEIDCLDKAFDANFAQAVLTKKVEGKTAGIVIEVLQKGYLLKDRILRAAMVAVSE